MTNLEGVLHLTVRAVSWAIRCPAVTVIDRCLPCLMARQWPGALGATRARAALPQARQDNLAACLRSDAGYSSGDWKYQI